jgi:C-terminal processing protease CtpA/Prc
MVRALGAAQGGGAQVFIDRKPEGFSRLEIHTRGYIGITTGDAPMKVDPSGIYVQYLAHPAIVSIDRDSPAQAAGILVGDSLIAYDGVDVVGRMLNLNRMLIPDRKLGVTVRRAGENKEYQLTVARAPMTFLRRIDPDEPLLPGDPMERASGTATVEGNRVRVGGGGRGAMPAVVGGQWIGGFGARGGGFTISSNGVFGASMETLEPVLAKAIDRPPGVLVKRVPEATVAAKAGLLPGDVIIAVGGQSVTTLGEVQEASVLRAENRTVTFQVVRDKKPRVITVTWGAPPSP